MTIDEPVTVGIVNDIPKYVIWKGRNYIISKIGLHHTFRGGRTLYHIFSVVSDTLFFKLRLNTDSLIWKLTEISDGF